MEIDIELLPEIRVYRDNPGHAPMDLSFLRSSLLVRKDKLQEFLQIIENIANCKIIIYINNF